MKKIHLIQHTHWDREWYFTENDSTALLYYFIDDLMTRLETDPKLGPFVLDGQTVILEDYFLIAPENRDRLQKFIQAGRILIGPWYSQSDFLTVGAESLTRNLLLGLIDCQALGRGMNIGYVPDSFGQMAQLPMLLNQFNIDKAVLWRGWSERLIPNTEFHWYSCDGSRVTTAVYPWGYGCAKWLPTEVNALTQALTERARKQGQFAATDNIMLPNGNDQAPFEYQIPGLLAAVNQAQSEFLFTNSSFEHYFQQLEQDHPHLPSYRGEMLDPKYMRIHRGIFSTRVDIKQANAQLEKLVSRQLEPLLSINFYQGLPYPQQAINRIWRQAMKSHAHDSIGGCNSDRVNQMVLDRLQSGLEMAEQLLEINLRKLTEGIQAHCDGNKVVIVNSLPKVRNSLVELTFYTPSDTFTLCDAKGASLECQILDRTSQDMSTIIQELSNNSEPTYYHQFTICAAIEQIPALGYTTLYLKEGDATPALQSTPPSTSATTSISNTWFTLSHHGDQTLSLLDHRNGQRYNQLFEILDGSDAGDNYNYSPLAKDWLLSSTQSSHQIEVFEGPLLQSLVIHTTMAAPADLHDRIEHRCSAELPICLKLTLRSDRPCIQICVDVDNRINDHRLQMLFPTGVHTSTHFADQPFGTIERPNHPPEMALWQEEGWTEAPVANYPMQSWVLQHDGHTGLAVVTDDLREYEIRADRPGALAITLLRSVGWLGNADLTYRPGRASGMHLPSPDSQIQGMHRFTLSLVPFIASDERRFWQTIEEINTPLITHVATPWSRFKLNDHGLKFPDRLSIVQWDSSLHFSTLKKAEHTNHLMLRAFNPMTNEQPLGELHTSDSIHFTQLDETTPCDRSERIASSAPVTFCIEKQS